MTASLIALSVVIAVLFGAIFWLLHLHERQTDTLQERLADERERTRTLGNYCRELERVIASLNPEQALGSSASREAVTSSIEPK